MAATAAADVAVTPVAIPVLPTDGVGCWLLVSRLVLELGYIRTVPKGAELPTTRAERCER